MCKRKVLLKILRSDIEYYYVIRKVSGAYLKL
jgi:hypothetical protein